MKQTMYNKQRIHKTKGLELGLFTSGDYLPHPTTKKRQTPSERIQQIIQMGQLAEQAGLDIFQVGEAHQKHFLSQSQMTILASIAATTDRIKLSTGATIIGTADPVRVFEDAATIDLISNGRMELVCGRSQRLGLFKLLGYSLDDYEELFDEKFKLLLALNHQEVVNWTGEFRPPLEDQLILPRPYNQEQLPIYRAVRGSVNSLREAAQMGVPIYCAQLDRDLDTMKAYLNVYREELSNAGYQPEDMPIATAGYLYVGPDSQQAIKNYQHYISAGYDQLQTDIYESVDFEHAQSVDSLINVGSPSLVVDKLLKQHEELGHQRFVGQIDFGGVTFDEIRRTIDLLGEKVIPEVKKYTAKK